MNCVAYKNDGPYGGSIEISGTTCNGVTGMFYLNYGETICMDTNYPLFTCDYFKINGPCNPPTPSVTPSNSPTPSFTPTVTPTTVCNYLTISGSASIAGVYQRVYGQSYYISGATTTVICGSPAIGNTATFSSSSLNRIIVYREINQNFAVLNSTGFSGCTNVLDGTIYGTFATGFTNVDGYLYPSGWDLFGRDAVIVYPPSCSTSPIVTRTPTRTPTQTQTPTLTRTPTMTPTPSVTIGLTPSVTQTNTASITPTNTQTPESTPTRTPTMTPTPSVTNTRTPEVTPTSTPTNSPTNTNTPTTTQTQTVTPTATFVCTTCNTWSYSNVPLEGDVIHYYSCQNGTSQTIAVSQFESGEFCNCDSVANPYSDNGTQLTQMGICLPTPTPSVTPSNTPTISVTPSNTPTPSETPPSGGELYVYGRYINSSQEFGYSINGGPYLGIGEPISSSCVYFATISGLQLGDIVTFTTLLTCSINGDTADCPNSTGSCSFSHFFSGTQNIYITVDASQCC